MKVIILLRFSLFLTLLVASCIFFGAPSFEMYVSKRIVFAEEKVDFDTKKPPAIMISHIPEKRPRNAENISACKRNSNNSFPRAIDCINTKLSNLSDMLKKRELYEGGEKISLGNSTLYIMCLSI